MGLGPVVLTLALLLSSNLPVLPFPRTPSAARELFERTSPALLDSRALANQSGPYTTKFGDLWPHVSAAHADSVGGVDGPLHVFVRQRNTPTESGCGAHFPFFVAGTALQNLVLSTLSGGDGGSEHDKRGVRGIQCAPRRPVQMTQRHLAGALRQAAVPNASSHVYFSGAALTVYRRRLHEPKDVGERGGDESMGTTSHGSEEVEDVHEVRAFFPSSSLANLGTSLAPLALPLASGAPAAFPPARGKRPQSQRQGQGPQLLQAHIWLASGGCTTPLHYDTSHNVMLQLAGTKRVMLLSPAHAVQAALLPALSPGHRQSAALLAGNARIHGGPQPNRSSGAYRDARGHESGGAPAGSQGNGALVNAINVTLRPGQSLFVPAYWFHHVTSESTSAPQSSIADSVDIDANGCTCHSPARNHTLSASLWVESRAHLLGKRLLASSDISAPLAALSRRVPLRRTDGARRAGAEQHKREPERVPWPELALRVAAIRAYAELIEQATSEHDDACASVDASRHCMHGLGGAEGGVTAALFSRYRAAFPQVFAQAVGKHCGAKVSGITPWAAGASASTVAQHIWIDHGAQQLQSGVTRSAAQLRHVKSAAVRELLLANIAEHLLLWAVGANAKNAGQSPWLHALPMLVARCWRNAVD